MVKPPQSRHLPPRVRVLYDKHDCEQIYDDDEAIVRHVEEFHTKLFGASDMDFPEWIFPILMILMNRTYWMAILWLNVLAT